MLRLMQVRTVLVVVLTAACGLTGCTHHANHLGRANPTSAGTRGQGPVILDGGALRIAPVPSASPTITRAFAARVLATTELPLNSRLTPALDSVLVRLPPVPKDQGALRNLHLALAWVYLSYQPAGWRASCSGMGIALNRGRPPASASRAWAVIIDATTGAGYEYVGAGAGFCFPATSPSLGRASMTYSVPFKDDHLGPLLVRQTVNLPPCGVFFSFGVAYGHGTAITGATAAARVPTGPCSGRATVRVMTLQGRIHDQPHGRLGLECWGDYDAALGPPVDCVPPT